MTFIPKRQIVSEPFVHQLDIIDKAIIEAKNQPSSPYINNSKSKRRMNSLVNQSQQQQHQQQQNQYQQYYKMKNEVMYSTQYYQYQPHQHQNPHQHQLQQSTVPQSRTKSQVPLVSTSQYTSPLVSAYVDVIPEPQVQQPTSLVHTDFGRRVSGTSTSSPSPASTNASNTAVATPTTKWNSNLFDPFKPVEFNSPTVSTTTNLTAGSSSTVGGSSNIWGSEPSNSRLFNNTVWA